MTQTTAPIRKRPRIMRSRKWRIEDIVDGRKLRLQLSAAHMDNASDENLRRKRVLDLLHAALFRGRMIAKERLETGLDGLSTAQLLSAVMDEVVTALYDYTTVHIFRSQNPTEGERMAVLAVGGYGRAALAPSSDVDLLFVRTYKQTPWAESVIEYMLYALWDLGLKVGHSFRTVDECIRLSKEDVTIRTAMLDRRLLCGDEKIFNSLGESFQKDIQNNGAADFIAAKLSERDDRYGKEGQSRYRVEPNVKEGKGGLRDLQTLFWLAKFLHGGNSFEEVISSSAFTPTETDSFRREARFLWTVRCHLHYLAGRPEELLSFDYQPEMAARMGYEAKGGLSAVERFMKRYFLAAKEVGSLTRILCARMEASEHKKPTGLRRFLPAPGVTRLSDPRFVLDAGRLNFTSREAWRKDPVMFMHLFQVSDEGGYDIHPDAMSVVKNNIRRVNGSFRRNKEARELFLKIVSSPYHPGVTLKRMNETGLLGKFVPAFGRIVAQTQFNMYHHYTVDEHTLTAVQIMNDIERGLCEDDHPLSTILFPKIHKRRALYLAMLLHDTGKGQGDQQVEGARTAFEACRDLGLDRDECELVSWLVGNHLEMSDTAQRRDLSEPRTISDFSRLVGTLERLRLLLLLTVSDIRAVGPSVWNAWKGQLLRELYYATEAALRGGRTDERSIGRQLGLRAEQARQVLAERFGETPNELAALEDAYWLGFDDDNHNWHAQTVAGVGSGIVSDTYVNATRNVTEVILFAPDRPGLFADLCHTINAAGGDILAARLFAHKEGAVLDVFDVQDQDGEPFGHDDPNRLKQLSDELKRAAEVMVEKVETPTRRFFSNRREAAFIIEPVVHIDYSDGPEFIIELDGRDRPGLMFDIAACLHLFGLSIHSAHAESVGARVHDVFYVRRKVGAELDIEQLTRELTVVLSRGEPKAPRNPAKALAQAVASDNR